MGRAERDDGEAFSSCSRGGRMRQVPRSGAPGAPAHCCKDAGDARSRPGAVTAALNGYCAASQSSAAEGAAGAR